MRDPADMRALTFTSLFPSVARPRHGIFVETRLQHLVRDCAVDARVIAPVPWFPFGAPAFGSYAAFARTPRRATRGSLMVSHPRYAMVPRLGVPFQAGSMARAARRDVRSWQRDGWVPDVIDAHYFYPDGVAAARLAQYLNRPLVVTARGSDINLLAQLPGIDKQIRWAANLAEAVIAVSSRLRDKLVELGIDPSKITVLRNGVDTDCFVPEERQAARMRLGLSAVPTALCVGNLVPEKGHALAIEALGCLPGWQLVVVGDGPARGELARQVAAAGLSARVHFLPVMPQADLRWAYSAADVMLLTSTREGWPNVVLEALACGTPVASMDVGAAAEMLSGTPAGRIVRERDPAALAAAAQELEGEGTSRADIRRHAASFDWATISGGQLEVFTRAIDRHRNSGVQASTPGSDKRAATTPVHPAGLDHGAWADE